MIKQLSIFVENKFGRLSKITGLLAEKKVNIRAMCIADTTDFGILRLIVDKPEEAMDVLSANGATVKTTSVMAVELTDEPGSLFSILQVLRDAEIVVEYMYSFVGSQGCSAAVIMNVNQPEKAEAALQKNKIRLLTQEMVRAL